MPKSKTNQHQGLSLPIRRMAFCLSAMISLGLAFPLLGRAEGGSDLNISKDGGNVNVNLNTASSSDVSIRRSDDIMVIKVPKSYKGGINIDPALKKNSVVQEVETSNGKAITIQSQQIYLHTWEGESGGNAQNSAAHEAKTDSKPDDKPDKEENGPGKPGFIQLSPTDTSAKKEHPTEQRSNNQTPSPAFKQTHSQHPQHSQQRKNSHAPQPTPLDLTRLLEQGSLLSSPIGPARDDEPESNPVRQHKASTESPLKHKHNSHKIDKKAQAEASPTQATEPSPELTPGDPESELLETDSKQQAAAIQASINGLLRIFLSLIVVLGMAVAFVKVLLPKLIEHYPDFFEKLRQHRQWSTEIPTQRMNNWAKPAPRPEKKQDKTPTPKQNPISINSLAEQFLTPPAPPASKKGYLERLKVAGEYFQVLQSTMLGKGKELHLVELKGKQFLVATTPYTVTLLKDLSEEGTEQSIPTAANMPFASTNFNQAGLNEPEIKRISQQRTLDPTQAPPQFPSQPRQVSRNQTPHTSESPPARPEPESPARVQGAQSETIAYLSDETPIRRVASPKPYATSPGAARQAARKSNIPQFPARVEEEDYPTYLSSAPQVQPKRSPQAQPSQPAYIDAEEVVVLEDYDDFYAR